MADDFIIRLDLDVRDAEQSAKQLLQVVERLQKEFGNDAGLRKATQGLSKFGIEAGSAADKQQTAAKAAQKHAQSLSTTRYALYDVSQTLAVAGAGMIALTAATYGASIAFERDFANVIRTSGVRTSDSIRELREDFIDLGQTIPVAISELAEIGTLGGQLGIAAGDLSEFTSVVARFSATTDLSVDKAATAFGRLKALLPDVADGTYSFEALASSILRVGVNSVATESDITTIATQLSSMAGYAGLSADELIGLSGALASVGTQPELARGTITRLFTQMGKAVSENGDLLSAFARTAGVSADEFASAFGTDRFGPIFLNFIEGIGNVANGGGDAVATLRELGITSVRDVPALTRLATAANSAGEAGKLLSQTMGDASIGIENATELADQFGVISGTVAAKLQLLVQNFQLLLVTVGQGGGVFGGLLDYLNSTLRVMTDIASNPIWNAIAQGALILTGFIGVLAVIGAVAAAGYAGLIALTQATIGLSAASGGATVSIASMQASMAATGPAGAMMARGVGLVTAAIRALGTALAIGLSWEMFKVGQQFAKALTFEMYEIPKAARGVEGAMDRVSNGIRDGWMNIKNLSDNDFAGWLSDVARGAADAGIWTGTFTDDLKQVDEAMAGLVGSGNLGEVSKLLEGFSEDAGVGVGALLERMPSLRDAFADAGIEVTQLKDGTVEFAVASGVAEDSAAGLAVAAELEADAMERLAAGLGLTTDGLAELIKNFGSGSAAFVDFGNIMSALQERSKLWAEAQADATSDSKDSWQDFYDGASVNIHDFAAELQAQIAAQAEWASNMAILSERGANALITQLAKMGPEGAQLAAQAVDLTTDELMKLEGNARIAAELASGAQVETWAAQGDLLKRVMAEGGQKAVDGMIAAQKQEIADGVPGAVANFVYTWNKTYRHNPISMPVGADVRPADAALRAFMNRWNGATINLRSTTSPKLGSGILSGPGRAYGGPIYGPGTSTSDSIPARLSHGEYVIRASSVRKYGMGIFDQLNRGVARFATGGPVGRRSGGGGSGSGIMELGPHSLNRIGGRSGDTYVVLDDMAIAKAANRGNKKIVASGGRP